MSHPFRSRLSSASKFAGALATASFAADASAQQLQQTEVESHAAIGLFVTYAFGAKQGLGLGIDGRVGAHQVDVYNCSDGDPGDQPYGGGAVRFEWFPASHMRLLILGQGGSTFGQTMGAHGELGAGYRWGDDGGLDTVIGAELGLSVGALALRFDPTRLELAPAAGIVLPPMSVWADSGTCWIAGRPRRTDDGVAPLPGLGFGRTLASKARREAPPEAVRIWGARAQAEWASVPAFRELTEQLRALAAPAPLTARCYDAYADEVRHAMLSGGHCAQLGDGHVMLERNAAGARAPLSGSAALVRLAVESWVDGCLGEGGAAACAGEEARVAQHAAIRNTQRAIAQDERRHAELAWDVMRWALDEGGEAVRAALHAAALAAPSEPPAGPSGDGLEAYGIVSRGAHEAIVATEHKRCLERLDRMLAG